MKSILHLTLDFLENKGISVLVTSFGNLDIDDIKKFNVHRVFDRRSMAYFAMGLAQQSNRPIILLLSDGDAAIADIQAGITEAYYQNVPIITVIVQEGKWLASPELVLGDKSRKYYIIDDKDLANPMDLSIKLNNAIWALTDKRGGPVFVELLDANRTEMIPAIKAIKKYSEREISKNICDIRKRLKERRVKIILDSTFRYTGDIINQLVAVSKKCNLTTFAEDLFFVSKFIGEQSDDFDTVLQFGQNIAPQVKEKMHSMASNILYIVVNPKLEENDLLRLPDELFECNWNDFLRIFTDSEHRTNIESEILKNFDIAEQATLTPTLNVVNSLLKSVGKVWVYGNNIYGESLDCVLKKFDVKMASYQNPTGNDGMLSAFIGQSIAAQGAACLCFIDSWSFLADMNALHIRGIRENVKICLFAKNIGESDKVRLWAESNGFRAFVISDGTELGFAVKAFGEYREKPSLLIVI